MEDKKPSKGWSPPRDYNEVLYKKCCIRSIICIISTKQFYNHLFNKYKIDFDSNQDIQQEHRAFLKNVQDKDVDDMYISIGDIVRIAKELDLDISVQDVLDEYNFSWGTQCRFQDNFEYIKDFCFAIPLIKIQKLGSLY